MSIFLSVCFIFCHWLFPSSIELSIRSCRENIWKKGIASKSQQTVCQRTSSTGALNITNVISICGALRCCRCIYWITYLQTSFFRFLLLSWECTIAMHQTSHGPYKKNIKWYSNKFSNVVIYYQCFCISLVRRVSLCGNGATSVS